MRTAFLLIFLFNVQVSSGQGLKQKVNNEMQELLKDRQLRHATVSLYIVNSGTNETIIDINSEVGVVPASILKIITSASAFELLGNNYRFKTLIGYDGTISSNTLNGNLYIAGGGDPTFGSWRWNETKRDKILSRIIQALNKEKITQVNGNIIIDDLRFSYQPIPDGWIWQDIGNYYGAGAWGLNWHENKFALNIRTNTIAGEKTEVISTEPVDLTDKITNLIRTGVKGSGDRSYIYSAPYSNEIFATGTLPAGEKKYTIYGSMPDPPLEFAKELADMLSKKMILENTNLITYSNALKLSLPVGKMKHTVDSILSPVFDSMCSFFMKESINLYGEAFVKAIGYKATGNGSTDTGMSVIRNFWNKNGIELSALKIIDGSGLSPANRLTTKSLVQVLSFAKTRKWFNSFYQALPVMNGIRMKSGYIGGVRAYAGYIKNNSGQEYSFAFVINNFDGNPSGIREKMWKLLDVLK